MILRASLIAQTVKNLLGREDPLEKEMATHSTILAWRTPWTVKPGGLQSMGTQKVAYDRATSFSFFLILKENSCL